jgi:hypothetical protein
MRPALGLPSPVQAISHPFSLCPRSLTWFHTQQGLPEGPADFSAFQRVGSRESFRRFQQFDSVALSKYWGRAAAPPVPCLRLTGHFGPVLETQESCISFSLATILPPELRDSDFSKIQEESRWTISHPRPVSFIVKTTTVSAMLTPPCFR